MTEPVKIICPYCYSPDLTMYMEGLSSAPAGTMGIPAGNRDHNHIELKCNACNHIFKPGDGKLSQEPDVTSANGYKTGVGGQGPDEAYIRNLCITQGKVTAIKYCTETYGWGLKESKDYIDSFTGAGPTAAGGYFNTPSSSSLNVEHVKSIMQHEGKLSAVKYVKDNTNWDLKQSKDYVDNLGGSGQVPIKREGCFIATACYGNYDAPEVKLLRIYRDRVLLRSVLGRICIRIYYTISPTLASTLSRYPNKKIFIRRYLLSPIVRFLRRKMADPTNVIS